MANAAGAEAAVKDATRVEGIEEAVAEGREKRRGNRGGRSRGWARAGAGDQARTMATLHLCPLGGGNCLRRDKSETEAWTDSLNGKREKERESYAKWGHRTNKMHSLHAKRKSRRGMRGRKRVDRCWRDKGIACFFTLPAHWLRLLY